MINEILVFLYFIIGVIVVYYYTNNIDTSVNEKNIEKSSACIFMAMIMLIWPIYLYKIIKYISNTDKC